MTASDILAWRKRLKLTQQAAAQSLGCHRRSIQDWEYGRSEVPQYIALACEAVEMRMMRQIKGSEHEEA